MLNAIHLKFLQKYLQAPKFHQFDDQFGLAGFQLFRFQFISTIRFLHRRIQCLKRQVINLYNDTVIQMFSHCSKWIT